MMNPRFGRGNCSPWLRWTGRTSVGIHDNPVLNLTIKCSTLYSTTMPQTRSASSRASSIGSVPDDVVTCVLSEMQATDLCSLACTSKRFKAMTGTGALWSALFDQRFGPTQWYTKHASKLCTSGWKGLYASKLSQQNALPWRKPCTEEVAATVSAMLERAALQELAAVFLVDGSGSVGDDEFNEMKMYISLATEMFVAAKADCKVSVLQFSNDVRVERPLQAVEDVEAFKLAMTDMGRMNGGTNISVALQKAGQLLKSDSNVDSHRLLVLLTDGRVDTHQARESCQLLERLADEQGPVSVYAYGVGRGVDAGQLMNILEGAGRDDAAQRYVELCVRDEAPW